MRGLPVGTAYAVWVGIGAVHTGVYARATGEELVLVLEAVCLLMIIGGVLGLELFHWDRAGVPVATARWWPSSETC